MVHDTNILRDHKAHWVEERLVMHMTFLYVNTGASARRNWFPIPAMMFLNEKRTNEASDDDSCKKYNDLSSFVGHLYEPILVID